MSKLKNLLVNAKQRRHRFGYTLYLLQSIEPDYPETVNTWWQLTETKQLINAIRSTHRVNVEQVYEQDDEGIWVVSTLAYAYGMWAIPRVKVEAVMWIQATLNNRLLSQFRDVVLDSITM